MFGRRRPEPPSWWMPSLCSFCFLLPYLAPTALRSVSSTIISRTAAPTKIWPAKTFACETPTAAPHPKQFISPSTAIMYLTPKPPKSSFFYQTTPRGWLQTTHPNPFVFFSFLSPSIIPSDPTKNPLDPACLLIGLILFFNCFQEKLLPLIEFAYKQNTCDDGWDFVREQVGAEAHLME